MSLCLSKRTVIYRNLILWIASTAAFVCAPNVVAQDASNDRAYDAVFQTWRDHAGVQACDRCHNGQSDFAKIDTSYSRQDELKFWITKDKHAIARRRVEPLSKDEVLEQATKLANQYGDAQVVSGWLGASNVLSKRIKEKLRYNDDQFRDNCLTCHGGYRHDVESDKAEFAADQPGISCNYCHQVGTTNQWVLDHNATTPEAKAKWRGSTANQKESLGMRDLVTTSRQASLCFDCHVGNRKQNQFVTHEMYAAGHPPLPSIEVQTFCEQMPQHWRSLSTVHDELPDGEKDSYFRLNLPGVDAPDDTYWNTRKLLVGALAARAKTLQLVIDSAQSNQWADYSLYDCAACHHELKTESHRQQRGYPAAPGRPRQHEWPDALFHIALFLAQDEPNIMELERTLAARFGAQPFGRAEDVSAAAANLKAAIDRAIEKAESTTVDSDVALRVLSGLAQTPTEKLFAYDSARQVVWAMRVVIAELESKEDELSPELKQVQTLVKALDQPTTTAGNTGIAAVLPAGRTAFIYPDSLRNDLKRRANFDSDELEKRLREINELLVDVINQ